MRRLKKKIYFGLWGTALAVLGAVRFIGDRSGTSLAEQPSMASQPSPTADYFEKPHPIRGVHSYRDCFPDVQDVQIAAAQKWGVSPVKNRAEAEERKSELVYVGACPYCVMDKGMTRSIPYLVPRAADLLHSIGRNYLDSLTMKALPLHRIIVTSVLRTEEDVEKLRRTNGNASEQSCHRFGTTFDIAYNRYSAVAPAHDELPAANSVQLMQVLAEVLRDLRQEGRCYVKYEVKQGCFHITTR